MLSGDRKEHKDARFHLGDRVKFTPDDVTLWTKWGTTYTEWKTVTIVRTKEG
jgi:hypothetical protein